MAVWMSQSLDESNECDQLVLTEGDGPGQHRLGWPKEFQAVPGLTSLDFSQPGIIKGWKRTP